MVNKFGTFIKTVSQEDSDFYAEIYGKEEAAKFLGCKITSVSRDLGDGSVAFHWNAGDACSTSSMPTLSKTSICPTSEA